MVDSSSRYLISTALIIDTSRIRRRLKICPMKLCVIATTTLLGSACAFSVSHSTTTRQRQRQRPFASSLSFQTIMSTTDQEQEELIAGSSLNIRKGIRDIVDDYDTFLLDMWWVIPMYLCTTMMMISWRSGWRRRFAWFEESFSI